MTTTEEVQTAWRSLSTALNDFNDNERAQAFYECLSRDHRTLQQNFWRMMIKVIMFYADTPCDPRNEASVQLCKLLSQTMEEGLFCDLPTV